MRFDLRLPRRTREAICRLFYRRLLPGCGGTLCGKDVAQLRRSAASVRLRRSNRSQLLLFPCVETFENPSTVSG
jgi:hypothetical protein